MDSTLLSVGLPAALAVVMFGLGLSLTVGDFTRIAREPRAVAGALSVQLLALPLLCFGLVELFDLDPVLGVGMMLLAASPGGTTANLFSRLFKGDVALNITLTAVNSVLAVITLPIVVTLAFAHFDPAHGSGSLGLQFDKLGQVFAIVLVPVVIGMLVRRRSTAFAERADRPVRILSAVVLAAVIAGALIAERENIGEYLAATGLVAALFCVCSLVLGYAVPRLLRVGHGQAIASAFEVGVHNSTLAITVAVSVLGSEELAVPAAVYGVLMFPLALAAGQILARRRHQEGQSTTMRTALVTGASSGIGRAAATALAARGHHVIGTSRDPDAIAESDRIRGVEYAALDLTDAASVDAFAERLHDVDILINNAGESQSGPIEHLPMETVERLFRLNVFAPVRLTQLALPGMRARGYGRIVMVGSMLASFPLAYRSSYVATKAAVKGFAEGAHLELSPLGVQITTVEPGAINTGISQRRTSYIHDDSPYAGDYRTMLGALARNELNGTSAEKVAATIVNAVEASRPRPMYAVGSRAPVVFVLQRLVPRSAILRMVARIHGLNR